MRVAVDAMGGDKGPDVVVPGSLMVLDDPAYPDLTIQFYGNQTAIEPLLAGLDAAQRARVSVHHTDVEITMDDAPAMAVRRKPTSGIALALKALKSGDADSVMSLGNSGAIMAGAIAILGRVRGVHRPALVTILPTLKGRTIMLDLGAIVDPKAQYLVQFAQMATAYGRTSLGLERPRVALLSNGEEASKGNQLVQDVYPMLASAPDLNFIGNCEGKELLRGDIEIIVTDGFTGNVALKSMEGTMSVLNEVLREEMTRTFKRKLAAMVLRPAFKDARKRLDYEEIGGAPLLGVNGTVIVGHGRSVAYTTSNAVRVAYRTAKQNLPEEIAKAVAS
jgi:glycerol-3-phosphate acyltransferase PlsX